MGQNNESSAAVQRNLSQDDHDRLTRTETRVNILEQIVKNTDKQLGVIDDKLDKSMTCIPLLQQTVELLNKRTESHDVRITKHGEEIARSSTKTKIIQGIVISVTLAIFLMVLKTIVGV